MNEEVRKSLISLGIFLNILLTSACGKTIDCNIETNHMHVYKNNYGITRYIDSEDETVHNINDYVYYRTDDYVELNDENKDIYRMISNKGFISIADNEEKLCEISDSLKDYYEFRYYYYETETKTHTYSDGDGHVHTYTTTEEVKKYSWTTNPNHSRLTGEKRIITNVFYGYKIVKDKNGYKVISSTPVDDIRLLIEMGYDYVGKSIYNTMNREDYLKETNLYGHVNESDLKDVYVLVDGEYVLYNEYILRR